MGERRDILDAFDVHAGGLQRGDRALTTATGPLDADLEFLDPELGGLFRSLLGCTLPGKGRALATPLESTRSTTCPTERVSLGISNRNGRVVKTRHNKGDSGRHAFLFGLGSLGHESTASLLGSWE